MENPIFNDFQAVSKADQKEKIISDLGDNKQFEDLCWHTAEGIIMQPIYHKDDAIPKNKHTSKSRPWKLGQYIQFTQTEECEKRIEDALANEVEAFYFEVGNHCEWISKVVNRLKGEDAFAYFVFNQSPSFEVIQQLNRYKNAFLLYDPYGLSLEGRFTLDKRATKFFSSNTSTFFVNVALYANAGGNAVQQIAFALAHLNEYLTQNNTSLNASKIEVLMCVAQGSTYFTEIAKLIALRTLAENILGEYPSQFNLNILALPLQRNKTRIDYNVNLLRTSTEIMSAILGDADVVINLPYDLRFNSPNHFSDRMARNQLLILKHESYFDQLSNVTQGAYFIEALVRELKQAAWALFLEVEASGGWLKQTHNNSIQNQINQAREEEQERIDQGKSTVVGVNKFVDETSLSAVKIQEQVDKVVNTNTPLNLSYTTP